MEALDEVGQLIFGIDLDALWVQRPSQLRRILLIIDAGDLRCGGADHLWQHSDWRDTILLDNTQVQVHAALAHLGFLIITKKSVEDMEIPACSMQERSYRAFPGSYNIWPARERRCLGRPADHTTR